MLHPGGSGRRAADLSAGGLHQPGRQRAPVDRPYQGLALHPPHRRRARLRPGPGHRPPGGGRRRRGVTLAYNSSGTVGRRRARRPTARADRPAAAGRREDPSRTRQSLLTLATFRSWGIHWMTPHEGPSERLPDPAPGCEPSACACRARPAPEARDAQ